MLSNQKQIIEQTKFTCSPAGKAFEKQTKTIEDQGKNQICVIKEHGKEIIESNKVAKNDFNINKSGVSNEKHRRVEEKVHEFPDIKDKSDPNKLEYKFKTCKWAKRF